MSKEMGKEANLGYLFQPASQGYKDKEHWWRVKEGDGVYWRLFGHGNNEDNEGVGKGYGGSQNYQYIHVG